jgi:hypothetical protein
MKTLNLNKLSLLIGLFLVSAFFTTSANALCVVNGAGAIVFDGAAKNPQDANEFYPVKGDTTLYDINGNVDYTANTPTPDCGITPDTYKLNLYKMGICKANPDLNDLTSCQMFFESAAGIELDIQAGVSTTLDIPEFTIDPGTYQYLYVLLSNKLGMKWSGRFNVAVDGSSGDGNGGTYCWTSNAGLYPNAPQNNSSDDAVTTVHGTSLATNVQNMDCGTSEGTVVFANEALLRFSQGYCSADLGANGDKYTFEKMGVGAARGTPTASLLTSADVFATTCQTAAKIGWTTALDTSYNVTEDSTFALSVKATDANSLNFSTGDNNDIDKIQSGAPKIFLNVTD